MNTVHLIIPPSPFLTDERVFVSLGVLKVAAQLEHAKYKVNLIDLSGISNYEDAVRDIFNDPKNHEPIVGITATTPQMPAARKISRAISAVCDNERIVIGGPHPTLIAAAVKQELKRGVVGRAHKAFEQLQADYHCVVAGDGELAMLSYLASGKTLSFIDADDPKSGLFLTDKGYDASPFPARHLVDLQSYHYSIDGVNATSLIAQLGCPFQCGFCGGRNSPMLRRIRTRTTQSIINELEFLYTTYGYRGFMFYDDELNVNKGIIGLMEEIIKLQQRLGAEFRLRGFVKSELFNEQQAEVMYRAGFRWLLTGFESGSPRILENINKRATIDDNTRAVDIARKHGLKIKALMSVGHPGESQGTIDETHRWLLDIKPDEFDVTIITPYPGSPYYDDALETKPGIWTYTHKKNGDRLHAEPVDYNEVADYYKGIAGEYKSYIWTDHLSAIDIVKSRDHVENDVRCKLNIPFPTAAPAIKFEHSMGQSAK
jgi:anaerobic magnesium-protoporphyrin IX monomethyl ester cyclase